MKQVTPGEQAIIDELVLRRTDTFERPPWMQAHRAARIRLQVRKALAEPAADPTPTGDKVHHSA